MRKCSSLGILNELQRKEVNRMIREFYICGQCNYIGGDIFRVSKGTIVLEDLCEKCLKEHYPKL